jgi:lincosamide nucleotidyltransferase A/C/D/E
MEFDQVRTVLDALDRADVRSWVAGGWGVALLVGRQSRDHRDLDLVVDERDLHRCREVLERLGYAVETDWLPTRVELAGPEGSWVDVHPLSFDADGHARLILPDGSHVGYPPEAFTTGVLDGRATPCLSAEQQRRVHAGYQHRAEDRHDLAELDRRRT